MMSNLMRSNQRWLMIVISVLMLVSLIWYFNNSTHIERLNSDRAGNIYGHSLTVADLQRVDRQIRTAADLGLAQVVAPELTRVSTMNEAVVNQLVMQHEADAMGILPSQDEIADAEQKLTAFQAPGGKFDPAKYADIIERLNSRGFTEKQIEELTSRDLQYAKLREIVGAAVLVSPTEVRATYEQGYAKTQASVLRLRNTDFLAGTPEPTEDDIKKTYDAQQNQYMTRERRKVQYVRLGLDDAQSKFIGRARMDALKPLGDQALAFSEKLAEQSAGKEDFAGVAKAMNLEVKETPEFEEEQTAGIAEAAIPQFIPSAFLLTDARPDSDVPLRTGDAFYILHLSGTVPARPLTLDEARPKIAAALKDERARAALAAKAEEIRAKIADGLKAGKSFPDAAKEAGQAPQDLPVFSLAEPPAPGVGGADFREVAVASMELGVGDLSKFVTTPDGGALVFVGARYGIDEAKFEQEKERIAAQLRYQKSRAAFVEWLRASREAADAQLTVNLRG